MRIAYLIMTHQNPRLLQRTIRTLSFGDHECGFFIHLDLKTSFDEFASITGQNVYFLEPRIPVYWGEFSQVDATLGLIRKALASPGPYDYFVLITGACYPLRSGAYIRKFFESSPGTEYMEIVKVPAPGYPLARLQTLRYPSNRPFLRFTFRALAKLGLAHRDHKKHLRGMDLYSGEGAWALTRQACQYVVDFMAADPHVVPFFRNTFAPDESFIHTILGNSDFLQRMTPNIIYAVWPGPINGHPAVIGAKEVAKFEAQDRVQSDRPNETQEMLFARKLHDHAWDLVDRIDSMIGRKEGMRLPAFDSVQEKVLG